MMRIFTIFVVAILLSAQKANLPDGQFWMGLSTDEKYLYALAWTDGFDTAVGPFTYFSRHDPGMRRLNQQQVASIVRCTEDMNAAQIEAIFDKYIRTRRDRWHQPLPALTMSAMVNACPVPPAKGKE